MADRQEGLVVGQLGATDVGIQARYVRDVVAVALQEPNHRVLVGEQVVPPTLPPSSCKRSVVTHLVGTTVVKSDVIVGAAVGVVGLPGGVGGLVDDIRVAGIVANNEWDMACTE